MNENSLREHYLFPGKLIASDIPHMVTTVLGSCVSVCLWDKSLMIGGINHFMLPLWNGEGLATPKYGNIAISKLYEKILSYGAEHDNIRAKVFGGGEVIKLTSNIMNVGRRNYDLAFDTLKKMKIPVIRHDVGGRQGRKIIFNTQTGDVLLKRLKGQVDDIRP